MRNSWLSLSVLALGTLSVMTVIITYLVRKGLSTAFVLFVVFLIVTVVCGLQVFRVGDKPDLSWRFGLLLAAAGLLSAVSNLSIYRATAIAPNAGLVITILGLNGGLVTGLALIFLRDKINLVQFFGILLGIVSIVIIGLGSVCSKNSQKDPIPKQPFSAQMPSDSQAGK